MNYVLYHKIPYYIGISFEVLSMYITQAFTDCLLRADCSINLMSYLCTVFIKLFFSHCQAVAYPGILFGGGGSTNSVEDRGQRVQGSGGDSPLLRGSGGSCNLVQEISFHTVKFS